MAGNRLAISSSAAEASSSRRSGAPSRLEALLRDAAASSPAWVPGGLSLLPKPAAPSQPCKPPKPLGQSLFDQISRLQPVRKGSCLSIPNPVARSSAATASSTSSTAAAVLRPKSPGTSCVVDVDLTQDDSSDGDNEWACRAVSKQVENGSGIGSPSTAKGSPSTTRSENRDQDSGSSGGNSGSTNISSIVSSNDGNDGNNDNASTTAISSKPTSQYDRPRLAPTARLPPRLQQASRPKIDAATLAQLRDHNHTVFRPPLGLDEWRATAGLKARTRTTGGIGIKPTGEAVSKEKEERTAELGSNQKQQEETAAASAPASVPGPTAAMPSLTAKKRPATLNDDIALFQHIQQRHALQQPTAGDTQIVARLLPEPGAVVAPNKEIRAATEMFRKAGVSQHALALAKRRACGRQRRQMRAKRICLEGGDGRNGNDSDGVWFEPQETTNAPLARELPPLPIEPSRVVVQYTVFRTRRLPLSLRLGGIGNGISDSNGDGWLAGKIIRGDSFVDKHRANRQAAALVPRPGPTVARIEQDYGMQDAARDGMFFARVHYINGDAVFVYVDREAQQLGRMDPAEYADQTLKPAFRQLVLAPRFDVFVFLRKPLHAADGRYVIIKYDDAERAQVELAEEDDDDDQSDMMDVDTAETEQQTEQQAEQQTDGSNPRLSHGRDATGAAPQTTNASLPTPAAPESNNCLAGAAAQDTTVVPNKTKESVLLSPELTTASADLPDAAVVTGSSSSSPASFTLASMRTAATALSPPPLPPLPPSPPPPPPPPSAPPAASAIDRYFEPMFEGSFTTQTAANARAIDAFARWTRPPARARMDALINFRDVLQPYIAELRQQWAVEGGNADGNDDKGDDNGDDDGQEQFQIIWTPEPQLRYSYEAINVMVVKSRLQGPLDLTGAFDTAEAAAAEEERQEDRATTC